MPIGGKPDPESLLTTKLLHDRVLVAKFGAENTYPILFS